MTATKWGDILHIFENIVNSTPILKILLVYIIYDIQLLNWERLCYNIVFLCVMGIT